MMKRVLEPEILDELDPSDPEAVASRRDLRCINFLMGNERWILRQLRSRPGKAAEGIVEWGAGSGDLLRKLGRHGPARGVDLVPRPEGLADEVGWRQGDVFDESADGGVLVANLFLHHFDQEGLRQLGRIAQGFSVLCFVEPLRRPGALTMGRGMLPFVNRVTKHDMIVSIRAGFVPGELKELLGLDPALWEVSERCSWRGGLRVLACRV
ncbi:hypothetical protein [Haloferula rosea]|nr:hypothetical protein [Haloferula rosea]